MAFAPNHAKNTRKDIADDTLKIIERRSYTLDSIYYDLSVSLEKSCKAARYYAPDSNLSDWNKNFQKFFAPRCHTQISFLETTTLKGALALRQQLAATEKIGVLNFASARKPGGGFKSGAKAQEESIARSSTLFPTIQTDVTRQFYTLHNRNPCQGYYSHAMIYSPGVTVFKDDDGTLIKPYAIDVLTSAAVNAGQIKQKLKDQYPLSVLEKTTERDMTERMARILFLFEQAGASNLVLGSFGTGVFQNDVAVVARIWADLLGGRFKHSFSHVAFAILDNGTFVKFRDAFESSMHKVSSSSSPKTRA